MEGFREIFNEVYEKALKALHDIKDPGQGYSGILLDIEMEGSPTEINLEEAFDKLSDTKILEISEKYS